MTRDEAVQRINEGLGFRPAGNPLETSIQAKLREAQRDLERGKSLPKFLLQQDQTFTLVAGTHTVALPAGFLREDDDNLPHYMPTATSSLPVFLERRQYEDAVLGLTRIPVTPKGPTIYVRRRGVLDFIIPADVNYTLTWSYYKAAVVLNSNITNEWLVDDPYNVDGLLVGAPEWLIGEAGFRMAQSLRDDKAVQLFDGMRTQGRAACFGEDLVSETSGGPLQMGANL